MEDSRPDLIQGVKRKMVSFTRLSEYEREASLYDDPGVTGVWIDNFLPGRWYFWLGAQLAQRLR